MRKLLKIALSLWIVLPILPLSAAAEETDLRKGPKAIVELTKHIFNQGDRIDGCCFPGTECSVWPLCTDTQMRLINIGEMSQGHMPPTMKAKSAGANTVMSMTIRREQTAAPQEIDKFLKGCAAKKGNLFIDDGTSQKERFCGGDGSECQQHLNDGTKKYEWTCYKE